MRGGARKGAGRKPRAVPVVAIILRVEPEIAARFKAACEAAGLSQPAQFSAMVAALPPSPNPNEPNENKTMKLTIYSRYHDDRKVTRSSNPQYVRRLVESIRRGDGDEIRIRDEGGVEFVLVDRGQGLELLSC